MITTFLIGNYLSSDWWLESAGLTPLSPLPRPCRGVGLEWIMIRVIMSARFPVGRRLIRPDVGLCYRSSSRGRVLPVARSSLPWSSPVVFSRSPETEFRPKQGLRQSIQSYASHPFFGDDYGLARVPRKQIRHFPSPAAWSPNELGREPKNTF